ncbi:single-stranded DNA-binding protein [Cellulophaga tyrosinoxydans]|uniref:Single-stranded DNA-binding protein n=1 Tax=Cellulophaga tyrosinoxydans TaxID=504486 RepID=A0A1W1Z6F3_9FLAO|nr:single-stranded DNA-binding protein [Cellulophaga tyrosinoxydans]SMC43508.1 single-strand DNA-binding protein [Cellulophaga tyrosinoxydans]|tara:strand:- start:2485 stop:2955 length:471 start_codon:yes stop_codon:yes gene_type:complete
MSGTLNKVMLIGHLGDEVKIHYFDGGNCIARFPLATNETYTNRQTGEKVSNTDWHNIVIRNKAAEVCEKYLSKGDKIYVEGRLKNRQWQGEDGQTRYTTEVHVQDFTFLTTKKESVSNAQNNPANSNAQNSNSATTAANDLASYNNDAEQDDDLPF